MLFIPGESCDFPICRVFFVCFCLFKSLEIFPYLNVPKVQRILKTLEHLPENQKEKKIVCGTHQKIQKIG